jgi:acetyl-CoA carboxylase biotin carboxylase subunit
VAKVLAHGGTRDEAIVRMRRALSEFSLEGVKTTVPLLLEILNDEPFVSGDYHTGYLETRRAAASRANGVPAPDAAGVVRA